MMRAVSPPVVFNSCSSPSRQKTASPASIASSTPLAPLTSPEPSSTARICGRLPAGWRAIRPPGANRKTAAWKGERSEIGAESGAIVTRSSSSSRGVKATSASKPNRSTNTSLSHTLCGKHGRRGLRRRGARIRSEQLRLRSDPRWPLWLRFAASDVLIRRRSARRWRGSPKRASACLSSRNSPKRSPTIRPTCSLATVSGGYKDGTAAVQVPAKLHSAREGVTRSSSDGRIGSAGARGLIGSDLATQHLTQRRALAPRPAAAG